MREKLKSILLFLLVLSSVILTVFIWFDKKLWPGGYNFFVVWKNNMGSAVSWFGNNYHTSTNDFINISQPNKIVLNRIVNTRKMKSVYTQNDNEFDEINQLSENIVISVLKNEKIISSEIITPKSETAAQKDEWYNGLKNRSILIDYGIVMTPKFLGQLLGINKVNMDIAGIKEIIISTDDNIMGNVEVVIKDFKGLNAIKYIMSIDRFDFISKIDSFELGRQYTGNDYFYAFELDLHKDAYEERQIETLESPETEPSTSSVLIKKAILEPTVLIPLFQTESYSLKTSDPFEEGISQRNAEQSILKLFNFNPNTIRSFPESDTVRGFVENFGTIKIYNNKIIEFKTRQGNKGIKLSRQENWANLNEAEVVNNVIEFVESLTESVITQDNISLRLTSDLYGIDTSDFRLTFDYFFNGNLIEMNIPYASGNISHCIEVEVVGGYIKEYTQYFKYYSLGQPYTNLVGDEALDLLKIQYATQLEQKKVSGLFLSYRDNDENGELIPNWKFYF